MLGQIHLVRQLDGSQKMRVHRVFGGLFPFLMLGVLQLPKVFFRRVQTPCLSLALLIAMLL